MAFAASLIAYLGAVAGIAAAFLIALSALLATPDQPPGPARTAVAAHQPIPARAATVAGPQAAPFKIAKPQQLARSQLAKSQLAKSQLAKSQLAEPQPSDGHSVAQEAREQQAPLLDLRPYARQWAYQQEPDGERRAPGSAQLRANPYDWIW